jgi:hypothetical protein
VDPDKVDHDGLCLSLHTRSSVVGSALFFSGSRIRTSGRIQGFMPASMLVFVLVSNSKALGASPAIARYGMQVSVCIYPAMGEQHRMMIPISPCIQVYHLLAAPRPQV